MPDYLNPAGDETALEALGMNIDAAARLIELPAATIELDLPLLLQDWTVRGVRRNTWSEGSVLRPSPAFTDPAGRDALVFCPSSRVDISNVVVDADGQLPVALDLNNAHGSHLERVTGAHATRACIAVRNTRGMTASNCKATGWNEDGRLKTGTGWLVEKYAGRGTEQRPSQNLFMNCSATWCGGDGIQIVGDYNKWIGGIVERCSPVDASGTELVMRVTVAVDLKSVTYEQEIAPNVWAEYTPDTGPGLGIDIQGGDGVHVEAIWFEGVAVDCVAVVGRFHSIEKCLLGPGGAAGARSVRLVGGWRSSVVRCTMATGEKNRVAVHWGDAPDELAAGVHILRHGGSPVIEPFVGDPTTPGEERKGTHHVVAFCSLHSSIAHGGPGVEINDVLVPQ